MARIRIWVLAPDHNTKITSQFWVVLFNLKKDSMRMNIFNLLWDISRLGFSISCVKWEIQRKKSDIFLQLLKTELKCRLFFNSNSDCSKFFLFFGVSFCFVHCYCCLFFNHSFLYLTYGKLHILRHNSLFITQWHPQPESIGDGLVWTSNYL